MFKKLICSGVVIMGCMTGAVDINCSFAAGKWNKDDFIMVKSPRWDYSNSWRQESDHIVQEVPDDVPDKVLQSKLNPQCYVAMCLKEKVKVSGSGVACSSTMSFDCRMAPLIVIAPEFGFNKKFNMPEFREHWEVVLFDEGINVWHHTWKDGKPAYVKVACLMTAFLPKTKYELKTVIKRKRNGCQLEIECGGYKFGCYMPMTAKSCYVGIIACEGRNRFYDLKVSGVEK